MAVGLTKLGSSRDGRAKTQQCEARRVSLRAFVRILWTDQGGERIDHGSAQEEEFEEQDSLQEQEGCPEEEDGSKKEREREEDSAQEKSRLQEESHFQEESLLQEEGQPAQEGHLEKGACRQTREAKQQEKGFFL